MASSVCEIVSPSNRTAAIWKPFGFKKDCKGKLIKTDRAFCKVCRQSAAHGGSTTNVRNHLRALLSTLYYELLLTPSTSKIPDTEKQETVEKYFSQTDRLSSNSQRYMALTEAVVDFICRDIRPVNVGDGNGFLQLMHVAEPQYVVPCTDEIDRSKISSTETHYSWTTCPTDHCFIDCDS